MHEFLTKNGQCTKEEWDLLIFQITGLHNFILRRAGFENYLDDWRLILRVINLAFNYKRLDFMMEFISEDLPALIEAVSTSVPAPTLLKLTDMLQQATSKITALEVELRQVKSCLAAAEHRSHASASIVTASAGASYSSVSTSVSSSALTATASVFQPLLMSAAATASNTGSGTSHHESSRGVRP